MRTSEEEQSYLCKSVDLDIQETDLRFRMTRVHHCASFCTSVDDKANCRTSSQDSIRPKHVLRRQRFDSGNLYHGHIVFQQGRGRIDGEGADERVNVLDRCVGYDTVEHIR